MGGSPVSSERDVAAALVLVGLVGLIAGCSSPTSTCPAPATSSGLPRSQLVAYYGNTCAISKTRDLYCWGDNLAGQVGAGDQGSIKESPSKVANVSGAAVVGVGAYHVCMTDVAGCTWCWGAIYEDLLDLDLTPKKVDAPSDIVGMAGNMAGTCAVTARGTVACWGHSEEVGLGSGSGNAGPAEVPGAEDIIQVAAAFYYTCALKSSGTVVCWGDDNTGVTGQGTRPEHALQLHPVTVPRLDDAVYIAAGEGTMYAIRRGGQVVAWGGNDNGEIGDNTTTPRSTPTPVIGLTDGVKIAAGLHFACAIRASGALVCWGWNAFGQLGIQGDPMMSDRWTPTMVPGLVVDDVTAGANHVCAHVVAEGWRCWGGNGTGELGNPKYNGGPVPQIPAGPVVFD
jgi:alpha-tubulin suppressor-like RCC1 family protein